MQITKLEDVIVFYLENVDFDDIEISKNTVKMFYDLVNHYGFSEDWFPVEVLERFEEIKEEQINYWGRDE